MSEDEAEKFTPGAWGVWLSISGRQFLTPVHDPSRVIAELSPVEEADDQDVANADLLMAAPWLYHAMKALLSDEHTRDVSIYYSEERDADMRWTAKEKEDASERIARRESAGWRALDKALGVYGEEGE